LFDYSFSSKNLSVFGTGWTKKVKEASTDDRDVVDSELQHQIADATHDHESFTAIMGTLWSRLEQPPKQWKIIYKVCSCRSFFLIIFILPYCFYTAPLASFPDGSPHSRWKLPIYR
jgi:hypothetical protein